MKYRASGFGVVQAILTIIVICALVGIGWYVWGRNHQSSSGNTSVNNGTNYQMAEDPYKGWNKYEDENVSLKYPDGWKISDISGRSGPKQFVSIVSPDDSTIDIDTGSLASTNKRLELTVGPLSSTNSENCREKCKIYDAVALDISKANNSKLVISDWDSQGSAQVLEVVDDNNAKSGVEVYRLGATINNMSTRIYGSVAYNTNTTFGRIKDVKAFESIQTFKDLVKLLNSINIK